TDTATATEANPGRVAGRGPQTAGSHGRTGLAAGRDGLRDIVIDALRSVPGGRGRLPRHRRGSCPGWGRPQSHSPSMISALDCLVFSTLAMTSSDFSLVRTPTAKTMAVTMRQASSPQPNVSTPRLPSP